MQQTQLEPKSRTGEGGRDLREIALQTSRQLPTVRSRHVFTDKQGQCKGQNFDHEKF